MGEAADTQNDEKAPLRSVHTKSFAQLLGQARCSLLVTTYQAGKLITVRDNDGVVNTHFRLFAKPMGLAANASGFSIGCAREVHRYVNMPAVSAKLQPPDKHDACFLPRATHITGDIDIHEMDWDKDGELWCVNTRFSCLSTLDAGSSFVPRWRPRFISALSPEDRCHLNGLGMRNGTPSYVTALGSADTPQGWRENKAKGGVLIDVDSGETIASALSMPHSPRWYDDRLWVLESGRGSLATVDPATGKVTTVATLPGFTRGLDFLGPYAFVGLSQVRESAVFSGIPITETKDQRNCGVWVVEIRSGQIVAFLRFEDAVQEIFAVGVLRGLRFPEILEPDDALIATSYMVPDEALKDVAPPRRAADGA
ncbi:MAG: TIGR03032 family protein [Thiohalocapsa sp.]|nr:TIGR03032 family protein [Thiohalocapsa sp.]